MMDKSLPRGLLLVVVSNHELIWRNLEFTKQAVNTRPVFHSVLGFEPYRN